MARGIWSSRNNSSGQRKKKLQLTMAKFGYAKYTVIK